MSGHSRGCALTAYGRRCLEAVAADLAELHAPIPAGQARAVHLPRFAGPVPFALAVIEDVAAAVDSSCCGACTAALSTVRRSARAAGLSDLDADAVRDLATDRGWTVTAHAGAVAATLGSEHVVVSEAPAGLLVTCTDDSTATVHVGMAAALYELDLLL